MPLGLFIFQSRAAPASFVVKLTGLTKRQGSICLKKGQHSSSPEVTAVKVASAHATPIAEKPQSADLILGGARQKYSGEEQTKNNSSLILAVHILRLSAFI